MCPRALVIGDTAEHRQAKSLPNTVTPRSLPVVGAGRTLYALNVVRRAWRMVGSFDLMVGILAAVVVVVGAEGLLSEGGVQRLLTIGAVMVVATLVVAILVLAPWSLWRESQLKVTELSGGHDSSPSVGMAMPPPRLEDGRTLLIATIENTSPVARSFAVKIDRVEGLTPPTAPPWWVPWPHGSGSRSHTLLAYEREMVAIAFLSDDALEPISIEPDGELSRLRTPDTPYKIARNSAALELRVWDADTGVLEAEGWIEAVHDDDAPHLSVGIHVQTRTPDKPLSGARTRARRRRARLGR